MNAPEPRSDGLNSDDPETRLAAIEALIRDARPPAVEVLVRVLINDSDSRVRMKAAEALEQSSEGRAVKALLRILSESVEMY